MSRDALRFAFHRQVQGPQRDQGTGDVYMALSQTAPLMGTYPSWIPLSFQIGAQGAGLQGWGRAVC